MPDTSSETPEVYQSSTNQSSCRQSTPYPGQALVDSDEEVEQINVARKINFDKNVEEDSH